MPAAYLGCSLYSVPSSLVPPSHSSFPIVASVADGVLVIASSVVDAAVESVLAPLMLPVGDPLSQRVDRWLHAVVPFGSKNR